MDFNRGEFATHECLKDKYLQRLKRHHGEVVEYLAEHLMRLRRSKEQLGLCLRPECVDRYKRSSQYKAGQGMVTMSTHNQAVKCLRCKTVVQGHEESYFCIYCTDCYCPPCEGYVKYFDMAELDNMIRQILKLFVIIINQLMIKMVALRPTKMIDKVELTI